MLPTLSRPWVICHMSEFDRRASAGGSPDDPCRGQRAVFRCRTGRRDQVDEISLLIYPGLDGRLGRTSTIEADVAPGLPVFPGMKLQSMSTQVLAAGYVWLRYQVVVPAHPAESISYGDQPASLEKH